MSRCKEFPENQDSIEDLKRVREFLNQLIEAREKEAEASSRFDKLAGDAAGEEPAGMTCEELGERVSERIMRFQEASKEE